MEHVNKGHTAMSHVQGCLSVSATHVLEYNMKWTENLTRPTCWYRPHPRRRTVSSRGPLLDS